MRSKRRKMTPDFLDEIFSQVSSYQSENKCMLREALAEMAKKYETSYPTMEKWYYMSRGKNRVIASVAKKKVGRPKKAAPTAIAATSLSISSKLEAEKIIFDYIKGLSFFKRVLAVIIGLDKLCFNYGSKKVHTAGD